MSILLKSVIVIALAILLIIVGPIAFIWSLNTLFPVLAIQLSFSTWVASFLFLSFLRRDDFMSFGKKEK